MSASAPVLDRPAGSAPPLREILEKTQRELLEASRLASMAEVATGVLHNVGNVLNSLNVSAAVVSAGLRQSKLESLAKVSALLDEHAAELGPFLTADPKGRLVPEFLRSLARHAGEERARLLQEMSQLQKNLDHVKEIVAMQQTYATMVGVLESLPAESLMEDSLRMNALALLRHDVRTVRDFQPSPPVLAERGKVLQILINLIRNAKYALDEGRGAEKVLTVRVEPGPAGTVRFVVEDNGVGIAAGNLPRLFNHGFTTRAQGHGFGLHSSALAARQMRGSLTARSEGPGRGAVFSLELPAALEGFGGSAAQAA
ncbi:MAG TPA: ATP-binding protein [Opitutaceae bacterium]|nr:ATP-binding protein [Opitutaceae bacterium]